MKALLSLQAALVATLTENNAAAAKAATGKTPPKTDVDAWGLTPKLRKFIADTYNESNGAGALAVSIHATHPDRFDFGKAHAYADGVYRADRSAKSGGTSSPFPFPSLTAVKLGGTPGNDSLSSGISAAAIPKHRGVIVAHQIKGYVLGSNGDSTWVSTVGDKPVLLSETEIGVLVDTLTAAQISALLTGDYFKSVRDRAGIK